MSELPRPGSLAVSHSDPEPAALTALISIQLSGFGPSCINTFIPQSLLPQVKKQFADATLHSMRETNPAKWTKFRDKVSDNFRVSNPRKLFGFLKVEAGIPKIKRAPPAWWPKSNTASADIRPQLEAN